MGCCRDTDVPGVHRSRRAKRVPLKKVCHEEMETHYPPVKMMYHEVYPKINFDDILKMVPLFEFVLAYLTPDCRRGLATHWANPARQHEEVVSYLRKSGDAKPCFDIDCHQPRLGFDPKLLDLAGRGKRQYLQAVEWLGHTFRHYWQAVQGRLGKEDRPVLETEARQEGKRLRLIAAAMMSDRVA